MSDDQSPQGEEGRTRCGFVALVGAPNAGKSTLVNQLVGTKVSIVSHKVQTTRALVRGLVIENGAQIVFVDTPGIFPPKRRLDRAMVSTAWSGATDADVIALLIDARKGLDEGNLAILDKLAEAPRRKILLLNKIDTVRRESLLAVAQEAAARVGFDRVFMISALTGDGVRDVVAYLADEMPAGPWLYPADDVSDLPLRVLAAEITREKLFARLHDELPYASTVETEKWETRKDGSVRIEQTIYVERETQKRIVIGKGGQTVKQISTEARKEISEIIEAEAHLFLFVKVRENWADDPERYREMGLDFPKA
ncbi:GTPase Era [Hansschlegelia sp.]|uniref:GTPase Era n=1 Tax=Hansschlegelia sp. TaxID=2041892 RepID=UPI002C3EA2E5|nr:GTPase Era [Hansschlegelia sp.]HVI29068.1 GTPase Era [Hansschlegelia sp.]